jgi:hypothetical protein
MSATTRRSERPRWVVWLALVATLGLHSSPAHAQAPVSLPQLNVGVVPGVGWRPSSKVAFDGHVAADVLFSRTSDRSFGYGPRLELGTRAFDDLRAALGVSMQLPVDPLAIVVTGHGLIQTHHGELDPGFGGRVFLGLRPYNYYGVYSAGLGLTLGVDHVPSSDVTNVTLGVQLDGMWLCLPALFLVQSLAQ